MSRTIPIDRVYEHTRDFVSILRTEHLGDILACEPVARYARKNWPDKKIIWIIFEKYADALASHPSIDFVVTAPTLSYAYDWLRSIPSACVSINLFPDEKTCPITHRPIPNDKSRPITIYNTLDYGPLLEAFSLAAGLGRISDAPEYHINPKTKIENLPDKYVVIHCKSTAEYRDWDVEKWHKLVDYFAERRIYTIEAGLAPVLHSSSPFYIDKTGIGSIDNTAFIIKNSHFFFGIDSSLAHLANALRVNGLVIMGPMPPWKRYNPYTGMYSTGHMVGCSRYPTRYLSCEQVIERYEQLSGGAIATAHRAPVVAVRGVEAAWLPNLPQRAIIRALRPAFKRVLPPSEYRLYKRQFDLFHILHKKRGLPTRAFFRLLSLCGPTPAPVTEKDLYW